jgi:hypothetical protein
VHGLPRTEVRVADLHHAKDLGRRRRASATHTPSLDRDARERLVPSTVERDAHDLLDRAERRQHRE